MNNKKFIRCLFLKFIVFFLLFAVETYSYPDSTENIAKAYGIENFKKVNKMSYTFNVQINGKDIQRTWIWYPKTDEVVFVNDNIKYKRSEITDKLKDIDHKFINDNYWLLFPFHLIWDENIEFTDMENKQISPINKESLSKLIVKYVGDAGYTPNDIYELYYDDNHVIKEWVFRKGGSPDNKRAFTWEQNQSHNGIMISENHLGENNFRLWFTDIEIK